MKIFYAKHDRRFNVKKNTCPNILLKLFMAIQIGNVIFAGQNFLNFEKNFTHTAIRSALDILCFIVLYSYSFTDNYLVTDSNSG
jgi:hypothetical protein